jgi:hypothetical protein
LTSRFTPLRAYTPGKRFSISVIFSLFSIKRYPPYIPNILY